MMGLTVTLLTNKLIVSFGGAYWSLTDTL
jgi:hypothetical protein